MRWCGGSLKDFSSWLDPGYQFAGTSNDLAASPTTLIPDAVMINTGPWGMRWERWWCKVKSQYFPSRLYTSSVLHLQREGRGSQRCCAVWLHLHPPALPYIVATKPSFKLHPLPCPRLEMGIDSLWRSYSSASIIYCRDKRVGTFCFWRIFVSAWEKWISSDESVSELETELWRTAGI